MSVSSRNVSTSCAGMAGAVRVVALCILVVIMVVMVMLMPVFLFVVIVMMVKMCIRDSTGRFHGNNAAAVLRAQAEHPAPLFEKTILRVVIRRAHADIGVRDVYKRQGAVCPSAVGAVPAANFL